MRWLYTLLVYLVRPAVVVALLWRGVRNREHWSGLAERFGCGPPSSARGAAPGAADTLWVHAVSLGEVSAAAPVVAALRRRHPEARLVLTTATMTGRARARALFGDSVLVRFIPYDTPGAMRRVVARIQPRLLLIMETELWPNLFAECRRRAIPVLLASARLSPRSERWYRRLGTLFSEPAAQLAWVAAQTDADAARFVAIGARPERVRVIGNVKFDVPVDAAVLERGQQLRTACWPGRAAWIGGSTHPGEEEVLLTALQQLDPAVAGGLLLLVPRHPQRFAAVAELLERRGIEFQRRSATGRVVPTTRVLLVDTVGELAALYAAVDVAFVGGSLVPVGGHNLLEPAALGVPILTGPYQSNGADIARRLFTAGGALEVRDAPMLAEALNRLLANPDERRRIGTAGAQVVAANRGSVTRLMELIDAVIPGGAR